MITTTPTNRKHGFTLTEVIVALALSGILLTAVITTFIQLAKGGVRLAIQYDLETSAQMFLNTFGQDARQCTELQATNTTLTLVRGSNQILYAYDAQRERIRRSVNGTVAEDLNNVTSFDYNLFTNNNNEISDRSLANTAKMVQLQLTLHKPNDTYTQYKQSPQYILRNR